ncbi:small, acid-soluble spore protein L [Pullulanibacillus sp. KACC 23026]|nr:small, acid-soluble spore protein L [Pullulanibacillus sp. KACC 23026]WEG13823.1 small, acid-soluble spore protein L [Pullulanibacillus sp. KACC 23026]
MKKERRRNSGKTASSVNPQGLSEDVADQQPTTELEDRAKKKNTKI